MSLLHTFIWAAEHSTAQHSTAQHSPAQRSAAQHSTTQHSTALHSNVVKDVALSAATRLSCFKGYAAAAMCILLTLGSPTIAAPKILTMGNTSRE